MDILYYSNYCKHSQRVVQSLVKHNMKDKLSFICIDERKRDPTNNQMYIILDDGNRVIMPPNIHSVPSLMQIKNNYKVIYGDDILTTLHPAIRNSSQNVQKIIEPVGYHLGGSNHANIVSEKFTDVNMTPDELSSKGKSNKRSLYNYVSVNQDTIFIETPPDDYKPDKVNNEVTIDSLQQQRIDELGK